LSLSIFRVVEKNFSDIVKQFIIGNKPDKYFGNIIPLQFV